MRGNRLFAALILLGLAFAPAVWAQAPAGPAAPVQAAPFTTRYIPLGSDGEGLLYEPSAQGPKSRIALVFTHPGGNSFTAPIGRELATRGYRVLIVNYRGADPLSVDRQLPTVSRGVAYLRAQPGVQSVIVSGHSGGASEATLYENVAEHGAAACSGPEKVYPCHAGGLDDLQKPDGLILLDPPLGDFHEMSSIDPAVDSDVHVRDPALDMFSAANGFDAAAGRATYSADFAKRFYAAQSARNMQLLARAQARLAALERGAGQFADDEPFTVAGLGVEAYGARLYQPDTAFLAHTRSPHLLLKADGSRAVTVIASVRPPNVQSAAQLQTLGAASQATTVRDYLAHWALRTGPDYAVTADDIVGVDWRSGYDSAPGNAYGITVPTLVLTMGCHYFIVPGEIVFDRLAAKDKTYATVEGAAHFFTACRPQYGDTVKRTFDFVDEWLSKDARF